MRIHFRQILQATIPSILVYLCVDSAVEFIIFKSTGISLVHSLEKASAIQFGAGFHIINLVLFSCEMFLVILFYSLIRPYFGSFIKPSLFTSSFFFIFSSLFLIQVINSGIYPLQAGSIYLVSTLFSLPLSVVTGAFIYERLS
jgi:hypothetical protein